MNKIYRLVFNESLRAWQVVPETARARGKRSGAAVLAAGLLAALLAAPAWAQVPPPPPPANQLPTGGQVVAGQAGVTQSGNVMTIDQGSRSAAIDWQSFNVGSQAQVDFKQPDAGSVALNRVVGAGASQIFGRVTSNGQIFLTNANGVYFARSASVDVGGLVATAHQISLADFMAGNYRFTRNGSTGSVVNQGQLAASLGGYIALLAPEVRNQGLVIAQAGTAVLAAGEAFTLNIPSANTLADIKVEPGTIKALVDNGNAVLAPDGVVILSARAADQLQGGVIRHSGRLEAGSLTNKGGVIRLEGDDITLTSGSTIDASGAGGGGTVLVGGDWQGSGAMHQASKITMEQGASIAASATQQGDGGKVVLWSDVHNASSQTTVQGGITARGGKDGGNGGQVETSGYALDVGGAQVDAGAPLGQGGLWYLDPADSTIDQAVANSYATTLNTGTSVLNDVAGNITWNSGVSLNKTAGGDATLTLRIGNYALDGNLINLSGATIGSTAGALNLVLWTKYNATSYDGRIYVGGSTINTNGGHLWMGGSNDAAASAQSSTWNGLAVGGYQAATWATNENGLFISNSSINTGAGNVSLNGLSWATGSNNGDRNNGVLIAGGSTLQTTSGSIDISGSLKGKYLNGVGVNIGNVPNFPTTGNVTIELPAVFRLPRVDG